MVLVVTVVFGAGVGCGPEPPAERAPAEPVAAVQQRVAQGSFDSLNRFPYVGRFVTPTNNVCTAILITPVWALTANHCITGGCELKLEVPPFSTACDVDYWTQVGDFDIRFGQNTDVPDIQLDGVGRHVYQTPANAPYPPGMLNPVRVRIQGPVDATTLSNGQTARDVALIQLIERIPTDWLPPIHPPLAGKPSCYGSLNTDDFTATMVGYGSTNAWSLLDEAPPVHWRNWRTSSGWDREHHGGDEHYYYDWWPVSTLGLTTWWFDLDGYGGSLGGDSGGPLIIEGGHMEDDLLCSVTSRAYPTVDWTWLGPELGVANANAAVDSPANLQFMRDNHVVDADGRFMGECLPDEYPDSTLQDIDIDRDLIPDACDPCPTIADPFYRLTGEFTLFAPGDPAGAQYPAFVDHDSDRIPDGCDLCPLVPGAYTSEHRQVDWDLDGLGNACDLCNTLGTQDLTCCNAHGDCTGAPGTNRCFPAVAGGAGEGCLGLSFTGRCAASNDFEGDRIGDQCDSCPTTIQYNGEGPDSDGDGVADACDACPGTHPYGHQTADMAPECTTFDPLFGGAGCVDGVCNYKGRCTGGHDDDLDGIGDACDGCPHVRNPQGSQTQMNCNIDTERVIGTYPYKTDECDPNPCTYSYVREPTTTAIQNGEIIWNLVDYRAFTLPNGHPDAFKYKQPQGTLGPNGVPTATVGGRFCYCEGLLLPGQDMTAYNCHQAGCNINSTLYGGVPNNPWTVTQMMQLTDANDKPPASGPPYFPILPNGEVTNIALSNPIPDAPYIAPELGDGTVPSAYLAWNISALNTHAVPPSNPTGMAGEGVLGVLWTHVPFVNGIPHFAYTPLSNHYEAGFYGKPPVILSHGSDPMLLCGPLCQALTCEVCSLLDEIANLVLSRINPVELQVLAVTSKGARDLTESMSAPVLAALSEPDMKWVVPAEQGHWQREGAPLFAVMNADATSVRMVGVYANGMVVPARGMIDAIDTLAFGATSAPAPLPDAAIVLSSSENALFSIGGRLEDGTWSDGVRVYTVRTGAWSDVPITGPKLRHVIAATYHPRDHSLYVIDEGKPSGGGSGRLVRIDLRTLQTEVLGAWPRHGWFDRVYLTLGWDGTLILASSSSSKNKYAIASLELRDKAHPKAEWAVAGGGQLALPPTFTDQALTVPMVTATGVQNAVIRRQDLPKPHGQGIGSCL